MNFVHVLIGPALDQGESSVEGTVQEAGAEV